jgi:hypothetical protein
MAKQKRKAEQQPDGAAAKSPKTGAKGKPGKKQQAAAPQPGALKAQPVHVPAAQPSSSFKNKEKVLVLSTRGVTFRCARRRAGLPPLATPLERQHSAAQHATQRRWARPPTRQPNPLTPPRPCQVPPPDGGPGVAAAARQEGPQAGH